MAYCIPPELALKFKQGIASGDITPDKLANFPDSESRRSFLETYVGKEDAPNVNAVIESKLLLKNQESGLINGINKLLGENTPTARDFVSRVQRMDKILNPGEKSLFLQDLASQKLGTGVTYEEAQKITELSRAVTDAQNTGTQNMSGISDDVIKARNQMSSYVDSLKPVSTMSAIGKDLATIGRNNLLLNPSTLIKTSIGQFVNSTIEAITRRISTISLSGANGDLASQASSEAWDTFKKTGVNVAAMESPTDTRGLTMGGEKFDTTSGKSGNIIEQGIRKGAQISNKVAIDWQHVTPFTKVYQKAFYDMTNILSSDIASKEGLIGEEAKARSADILRDAAKVEPTTDEGKMVRSRAQEQAARATSTNETYASHFSLGVKKLLNKIGSPIGVPLGDLIVPIAKIPATIFANGVENAGLGLFTGAKDMFDGFRDMQSENLSTKYQGMGKFQNGIQTLGRTVGTMGLAFFVAHQFKPQDFRSDAYGAHFVRIGNTWINMEYMSAVSPALAGAMSARSGNGGILNSVYRYGAGAGSSFKSVPGVDELSQLYSTGLKGYTENFMTSRTTPTFIQNMFKSRPINRLFFGSTGVETTQQVKQDNQAKAKKAAQSRRNNSRK